MSEQEQEAVTETQELSEQDVAPVPGEVTEPADEPADPGEDAEPVEQIEGNDDDDGDEPLEQQRQAAALNEEELEKRWRTLMKENIRHANRLEEIMGDNKGDLIPCPVCMDGIAGFVYLPEVQQLSPEAITRIRQLIGLPDLTTYDQAKFATQCPDCHGMGEVKTGSLVNGFEVTTCETCQKQGWVRTTAYGANGGAAANVPPIVTGPMVAGPEQPDPEIAHLRERGFTVIPPMAPVNP